MRSLVLLVVINMLQSCASLRASEPEQVITQIPLQVAFERRNELSGQRVAVEGFLLLGKHSVTLVRADEGRSRLSARHDSCPRNSEADLLVLESALTSELHRAPGVVDMVLPKGRATLGFRRANRQRVVVSGILRAEKTALNLGIITIEFDGRLDGARLERVYDEQCR